MKLLDIYTGALETMGVVPDETAALFIKEPIAGKLTPLTAKFTTAIGQQIGKTQLYLPTPAILKEEEMNSKLKFHPACEDNMANNSDVLNLVIKLCSGRIYLYATALADRIIRISADKKLHEGLGNAGFKLIRDINANKTMLVEFGKVARASTGFSGKYPMVKLNIKRNESLDKKYIRTTFIKPYILDSGEFIINGRELTKKQYDSIMLIYSRIFEGLDKLHTGSNNINCPGIISVLSTFGKVMMQFDKLSGSLGQSTLAYLDTSLDWLEYVGDLDTIGKNELDVKFSGNTGLRPDAKGALAANAITAAPVAADVQAVEVQAVEVQAVNIPAVNVQAVNVVAEPLAAAPIQVTEPSASAPVQETQMASQPPGIKRGIPPNASRKIASHAPAPALQTGVTQPVYAPQPQQQVYAPLQPAAARPQIPVADMTSHAIDAMQQPLFRADGQPFIIKGEPFLKYIQASDEYGRKKFKANGEPELIHPPADMAVAPQPQQYVPPGYQAAPGYPAQQLPVTQEDMIKMAAMQSPMAAAGYQQPYAPAAYNPRVAARQMVNQTAAMPVQNLTPDQVAQMQYIQQQQQLAAQQQQYAPQQYAPAPTYGAAPYPGAPQQYAPAPQQYAPAPQQAPQQHVQQQPYAPAAQPASSGLTTGRY